jgi:thymidylate synthase (FAD)
MTTEQAKQFLEIAKQVIKADISSTKPAMEEDEDINQWNKGRTIKVLDKGFVCLVDVMGTDQRIVESARVSYKSASKGDEVDKKLLFYLYKNRHTSPFEMCKMTFNIKMPIFIARQYVRHRMQNLNEQSARYSQLPDDFYIPDKWRAQDTKNKQGSVIAAEWEKVINTVGNPVTQNQLFRHQLENHCKACYALYERMLDAGVAREMARMVLPLNIYTEFYCTWDLKNLLHFFSLRDDPHAQWEHQQYGKAMKMFAQHHFPWTMEAYDRFKFPCMDMEPTPDRVLNQKQVDP